MKTMAKKQAGENSSRIGRSVAKHKDTSQKLNVRAADSVAPPAKAGAAMRVRATVPEEMKTATLHFRLKQGLKEDATAILEDMGISVPEAIRVFLGRIVSERRFPFELEVPNATTRRAMKEARQLRGRFETAEALFDDLEKGSAH